MKYNPKSTLINASIDVLISYKKGNLNLTEAGLLFSEMTGLGKNTAEKFLRGMSRTNVKKFTRKDSKNV
jgi:hypothetical protein